MNSLIEQIFDNFIINKTVIPVHFLHYEGHEETYVLYQMTDADTEFSADDNLINYVEYYDFDVYSKGNYLTIIEAIKAKLKQHDFIFQPSRSSGDMFETDTGYYHRTLCFAYIREE